MFFGACLMVTPAGGRAVRSVQSPEHAGAGATGAGAPAGCPCQVLSGISLKRSCSWVTAWYSC